MLIRVLLFILFCQLIFSQQKVYIASDLCWRDFHEKFHETGPKSDEKGLLYGVQTGYEYRDRIYFGIDYRRSTGDTDYDGAIYSTQRQVWSPYQSKTPNSIWNMETRLGCPIERKDICYIPLFGIGYHYWFRQGENDKDYDERYSWQYLLLGCITCYKKGNFSYAFHCQAMYTQDADIEITNLMPYMIKLRLENKWQYEIEAPVSYKSLEVTPFIRNQNIGKSKFINIGNGTFHEPSSTTFVYGVRIALLIYF